MPFGQRSNAITQIFIWIFLWYVLTNVNLFPRPSC